MIKKTKVLLTAASLLVGMAFLGGCSQQDTPYQINNQQNYTVSIKYDANGGLFADNTSVVVDSYNVSELKEDASGSVEIALLPPEDARRGVDAFRVVKNGCFFAGWYSERVEVANSDGSIGYTYAGRWDFETDRLKLASEGSYKAEDPQLTLYAAWLPLFQVNFYDRAGGELLSTLNLDPTTTDKIPAPQWNMETGAIQMNGFPERKNYTYSAAYYDEQGTKPVDTVIQHPGQIDYSTGTSKNNALDIYIDWTEGEWFHIYTAEQFVDNASINGNYVIEADLNFAEETWPTKLMHGNFAGSIQGNGHKFINITATQTDNSKVNSGLFGNLTEKAVISDLILENATFRLRRGTRVRGASFGLLAGTISDLAQMSNIKIADSTLQIDSSAHFAADDYSIGLLCGMGIARNTEAENVNCVAVGDESDKLSISITEQAITLEVVNELT